MTIHTDLLADRSPALRAMVSGGMKEAFTGEVTLEEVDEETFIRFAQYVYTGDYKPPMGAWRSDSSANPLDSPDNLTSAWPVIEPITGDQPRKLKVIAAHRNPSSGDPLSSWFNNSYSLNVHHHPDQDLLRLFEGHAHLYILADMWDISGLKSLTLRKICSTLDGLGPGNISGECFSDLIKFTYEHTMSHASMDQLRELLGRFLVYEAPRITQSDACLKLIEDGGPFARDLVTLFSTKSEVRGAPSAPWNHWAMKFFS